jgi:lactoylglutathione lyase
MPIPIQGLFETHLTVRNLERSLAFYRDTLGLEVASVMPERGVAFVWLGSPGHAMLGLWAVGSAPLGMKLHLAFRVNLVDLLQAPTHLRAVGVQPCGFHGEPVEAPVVIGWMPAAVLYFTDPDGHSLEYLAMLDEPAQPERGVVAYAEWRQTSV